MKYGTNNSCVCYNAVAGCNYRSQNDAVFLVDTAGLFALLLIFGSPEKFLIRRAGYSSSPEEI